MWVLKSTFDEMLGEEGLAPDGLVGVLQSHNNPLWHSALFYLSDSGSHLDLGSNVGASLKGLDPRTMTCVEMYAPAAAKLREVYPRVIEGDACQVAQAMVQGGETFDRVTAFDFIEHLPKSEGERLLSNLERLAAREIVLFLPMESDELLLSAGYRDYMESLFGTIPMEQHDLQRHRSIWKPEELAARGYDILLLPSFHTEGFGAFFAAKYKLAEDREAVLSRLQGRPEIGFPRLSISVDSGGSDGRGFAAIGPGTQVVNPVMVANPGHIFLGSNVVIRDGARLEAITEYAGFPYHSMVVIGDGCRIENSVHIGAAKLVYLGNDVMVACRVTIMDHDHGYGDVSVPPLRQPLTVSEVLIDDEVWLGENVMVCKGVYIGKHAVIGANAVVTHDVPAFSVAAGNPARVIKRLNPVSQIWEPADASAEGNLPDNCPAEVGSMELRKSALQVECLERAIVRKNLFLDERDAAIADKDAIIAARDALLAGKESDITNLAREVSYWRGIVDRYHANPAFRAYFALKRALRLSK